MIVETSREIQDLGSDVLGYLGTIGISPSTFGFWAREAARGTLVDAPPRPPTQEEQKLWAEIRMKMKDLGHRRHYTFGLNPLWAQYRGKIWVWLFPVDAQAAAPTERAFTSAAFP